MLAGCNSELHKLTVVNSISTSVKGCCTPDRQSNVFAEAVQERVAGVPTDSNSQEFNADCCFR